MRKVLYISLLLMGIFSAVQAQKKIIYEDTSLLQKDDRTEPPVEDNTTNDNTAANTVDTVAGETNVEKPDTTLYLNNLQMPYDSVKNWKNLKEYAYTKYLDSLLKNKKEPEADPQPQASSPGILNGILGSGFVKVILWTLAICFVLFIIYRLFLADGVFQRQSKAVKNTEDGAEEEVITNESNFDALIRQALQQGNYRQAVRYQYLRTLHALAGKNFIQLAPDKTNFQYVQEILNRSHQDEFASLTLNYEYVWYGEFDIDQHIYQKIESGFINLNQKI